MEAPRRRFYIAISLSALAVLVLSLTVYIHYIDIKTEPITSWNHLESADCAVVLTGGAGRVREGLDLLEQKLVSKVVIAGVRPKTTFFQIWSQWPYYQNVREEDVVLERKSETTYGNAVQSLSLVEALHCRDILLVTSSWHMRRSFNTFRAIYPSSIEIRKHSIVSGKPDPSFFDLSYEVLKTLFYSVWVY